jgi:CheY-like chemotaxis protein
MLLQQKRILIVEDNSMNRIVFQMTLIKQGAIVDFERRGEGLNSRLRRTPPPPLDIIIMDLMLAEGVSGFDLFDQIRAIPHYSGVPVVAVSAMDPAVAIPMAQQKGMSGFIAKPIDDVQFPRQLVRILNGESVWFATMDVR